MRIATIYYDENRDQTTVKYSDDFRASGWVLRADVLKDLYGTIDTDYNKLFAEKPTKGEF